MPGATDRNPLFLQRSYAYTVAVVRIRTSNGMAALPPHVSWSSVSRPSRLGRQDCCAGV